MLKSKRKIKYSAKIGEYTAILIASVALSLSKLFGAASPLGVAICCILPINYSIAFCIGAFLSSLVIGVNAFSLSAVFSSFLMIMLRILRNRFKLVNNVFRKYVIPFICYLVFGVVFVSIFPHFARDYLILIVFSALLPVSLYLLHNHNKQESKLMLFALFIATLSSLFFSYINIGRIIAVYAVLICAITNSPAVCCLIGIISSCGVALYDIWLFPSTIFVCIVGVVCSLRKGRGKLILPLYAISISIICAFLSGAERYEIGFVLDTFIAVIAFMLTKKSTSVKLGRFFIPKKLFKTESSFKQKSANKRFCGDCVDSLSIGNMQYYILCDGMGRGYEAYKCANKLIKALKTLLLLGFSADRAIKMASYVLRKTQSDESFSTLDLVCANLSNGKVRIYKAGSCDTIVWNREAAIIKGKGYPIGILNECYYECDEFTVNGVSTIILHSDGVTEIEKMLNEIGDLANESCKKIAWRLLFKSLENNDKYENDDATVAAIRIKRI